MKQTGVAVIGCGSIANNAHIPAYRKNEGADIRYFCDILPERAEQAVETYGCGKAVTDYHEILSDSRVEAVSICTPNYAHAPIAIDCLKAGKHVLCEKPAARTYAEALTMQQAQHETGRVLNIGVCNRFNNKVNYIRDLIRSGELGNVYQVYVSFRAYRSIPGLGGDFTTKAVAGGGALIDWGVHFLDIVMYCCGDPAPQTVSAETFSYLGRDIANYTYVDMWAGPPKTDGTYDVDEAVTGLVRTAGPVITVNGAWAQNIGEEEMFIDFLGDKGGVRMMYTTPDIKIYGSKNGLLTTTQPTFKLNNMYEAEIDAFLRCIESGEKLPSHIDSAVITARMMQAMYDSADQHREVALQG